MMEALMIQGSQEEEVTVTSLLSAGQTMLEQAGVENPVQETVWLLEAALAATSLSLRLNPHRPVSPVEWTQALDLFVRRANREPLQYLLGTQEFCGLEFEVSHAVLIPRPETELLLNEAVRFLKSGHAANVVDVGTGSGCLAVALAKAVPSASVYAVDCSGAAIEVADRNIRRHHVEDQVQCHCGDLFTALDGLSLESRVNVVMSNPPYIPDTEWSGLQPEVKLFEPRIALGGGPDGMVVHRRLLQESWKFLVPGGLLAMEVGQGEADRVRGYASQLGQYMNIRFRQDAAGIDRVVCAERAR
jgi:release factor glutamine methyltransferase